LLLSYLSIEMLLAIFLTVVVSAEYSESLAKYLVDFAAAGYCIDNGRDSVANWTCESCKSHPEVKKVVTFITKGREGWQDDTVGFVAYANDTSGNSSIILTVSGTDPLHAPSLAKDFDFIPHIWSDHPDCNGCLVDRGFFMTYQKAKDKIMNALEQFDEEIARGLSSFYVTGHSLGGSAAIQTVIDLLEQGTNVTHLYTFGNPRLGNKATADYLMEKLKNVEHYRLTHDLDPVPQLPPKFFFGWRHSDTEVFYKGNDTGPYVICDGSGEDPSCQNSMNISFGIREFFNLDDHLHYVGMNLFTNYLACKI